VTGDLKSFFHNFEANDAIIIGEDSEIKGNMISRSNSINILANSKIEGNL